MDGVVNTNYFYNPVSLFLTMTNDNAVLHLNSFHFNSPRVGCFVKISLQHKQKTPQRLKRNS